VAPMRCPVPIPFDERPDNGVIGVPGEDEAGIDGSRGAHGSAERIDAFVDEISQEMDGDVSPTD
ncbi:MAG: hypothetical protein ACWGPN_06335, partial [Gammaproteobacteria bacterium]